MRAKIREFFQVLDGFRKLAMAVLFLLVAVILLVFNVIPEDNWLNEVGKVMIAYMATNIGEHITNTVKEYISKKDSSES